MSQTPSEPGPTTERSVELVATEPGRFEVRNRRGGVLPIGDGESTDFTPVELLLAAIAGCSALDIDHILRKRAEAESFAIHMRGDKIRDEDGNHLVGLELVVDATFPEGEAGDAARAFLPRAIEQTRDRLCTVSRTVALPSPVAMRQRD
jgi:uncharacterized OsmC-like protein